MPLITAIFDLPRMTPYVPKFAQQSAIWNIPSEEVIGIEVEAENVQHVSGLNDVWQVTEDGSLRNSGREFITHPVAAKFAPNALENLLNNRSFCFSPRTSVHVHLNCMDIANNQVIDILLLYCLYEKALFRFVGKGRQKNIYCVPITECNLLANIERFGVKAPWEKYTALNLLPLREHGTIEFRHMHGTTDVRKLSIWIDLITRLKEYVKAHSSDEIRRAINAFTEADIGRLSNDIWGDVAGQLEISDPDEVISRVPVVKLAMCKTQVVNTQASATVSDKSKYFQI